MGTSFTDAEPLLPLDARSMPATISRIADLNPELSEARFIGPPPDLDQPLPPVKLERLWLQNMKPCVAEALALRFDPVQLSLSNIQTPDLAWVGKLPRIRELLIEWNTKLESFEFLRAVAPLSRLRADGMKRTNLLDGLVHQPSLKWLWLGGGIDRRLEIKTLRPLSRLVHLEKLFLICVRVEEPSLTPLAALKELQVLRVQTNMVPMEEYARLAAELPDTEGDSLRGFQTLRRTLPYDVDLLKVIDTLDPEEQVMMVGKGRRRYKVGTDRDRIVKDLLRFRAIRDSVQEAAQAPQRG